jgi:hypothetical protein
MKKTTKQMAMRSLGCVCPTYSSRDNSSWIGYACGTAYCARNRERLFFEAEKVSRQKRCQNGMALEVL